MPIKTEMPTPFPIAKQSDARSSPALASDVANVLIDPDELLSQLSSEEKIQLLSGDDMWHTVSVPRLGIPRVRMSDGPNGVRGTAWTNGAASACFPCATGLAASFDVDLGRRVGEALGKECRARGVHCLLGPTTNIQRHPCGGRGFESFSEDPTLAGLMAEAWVNGVQSQKVMTTPKHFVANEQEFHRRSNNSVIDLRTLHEIYLEPFRLQCRANPVAFMTSYNRVNGLHVAEDPWLLRDILRKEFGFGDGLIISDWSGTYSSSDAIKASLDLEMPGPAYVRGVCVERDVVGGKLKPSDVDECVRRVLKFVRHAQESGIAFEAKEGTIDTPEVHTLLREAANASIVLLKNDANILPVTPSPGLRVAVIGSNAKTPPYAGGGSANLLPTYTVTPLQAVEKLAAEMGGSVTWEMGVDTARWTPLLTDYLSLPDKVEEASVVRAEFFDEDPWTGSATRPLFAKENNSAFTYFIDGVPKEVPVRGYISLKTFFTPDVSGPWELGLGVAGQADLYVDDDKVIDNTTDQKAGLLFFTTGAEERTAVHTFEAGRKYALEVRFSNFKPLSAQSPYTGRRGGIRIGGRPVRSARQEIAKAVKLAQNSDVAIVIIGTTTEWESEAYDRDSLKLPGATDDLVRSILQAVPSAIIVNQSGMPVEFPWLEQASTLLQAFFGGNECGTAIANAIFGQTNPGGKLPITWPASLEDYKHVEFGNADTTVYTEGLNVGYRWFDAPGRPQSAFPFGFGGSYSTFTFSNLQLVLSGDCKINVSFDIQNTGKLAGSTVGQVYVHQSRPSVEKPDLELAGFAKLHLEPGQTARATVALDHKAFSYYNVRRTCWVAEGGDYEIRIGTSSRDMVLSKPFHLENSWTWTGLRDPQLL